MVRVLIEGGSEITGKTIIVDSSKHGALTQCWVNVGPPSRRRTSINSTLGERPVFAGDRLPEMTDLLKETAIERDHK